MILPLHEGADQRLVLYQRNGRGFVESELDPVRFVPMKTGKT
jgi:protein-L-isoaspartate O-methyltransferase